MEQQDERIHVDLDVGNLCIYNLVLLKSYIEKGTNDELKNIAALGAQKLLNEIYKIPTEYHEHIPVVKLPEGLTVIPREKHVPKEIAPTKWEQFSKAKGIKNRKKEKLVWDETSKEWKPRYGYRSAKNKKDWLMEIPENGDINADYFAKAKEVKKERIAKNEYQRLRNIAVAQKLKVTNLESVDRADKDQLSRSVAAAKKSTASLGRFTDKLPKEKRPKNLQKRRKFKSNFDDVKGEKENNLKILQQLEFKKEKLDVEEAVQRYTMKPLREGKSDDKRDADQRKKNAKRNRFLKNIYRSGKKPSFKKRGE